MSLFYAAIDFGPGAASEFIETLEQAGKEAASAGAKGATWSKLYDRVIDVSVGEWEKLNLVSLAGGGLAMVIASFVLSVIIAAIVAITLIAEVQAWVVLGAGSIALGFSGCVWSRSFFQNYFRSAIQCGMKLMCLRLIEGVCLAYASGWIDRFESNDSGMLHFLLSVIGGCIVMIAVLVSLPEYVGSIMSGSAPDFLERTAGYAAGAALGMSALKGVKMGIAGAKLAGLAAAGGVAAAGGKIASSVMGSSSSSGMPMTPTPAPAGPSGGGGGFGVGGSSRGRSSRAPASGGAPARASVASSSPAASSNESAADRPQQQSEENHAKQDRVSSTSVPERAPSAWGAGQAKRAHGARRGASAGAPASRPGGARAANPVVGLSGAKASGRAAATSAPQGRHQGGGLSHAATNAPSARGGAASRGATPPATRGTSGTGFGSFSAADPQTKGASSNSAASFGSSKTAAQAKRAVGAAVGGVRAGMDHVGGGGTTLGVATTVAGAAMPTPSALSSEPPPSPGASARKNDARARVDAVLAERRRGPSPTQIALSDSRKPR